MKISKTSLNHLLTASCLNVLKRPDAVFFDWDGTLIDGFETIIGGYNAALFHFNLPLMTPESARVRVRKSSREAFPEVFGAENAKEAMALYYAYVEQNHLKHLRALDGAEDILRELKSRKIPMGIVSNKADAVLKREVAHLGWADDFVVVLGAGVAARDKPAPDPLLKVAADSGFAADRHELWYIGDTETDMQAAHAAGFKPVFIGHGLAEYSALNQPFEITPVLNSNELINLLLRSI